MPTKIVVLSRQSWMSVFELITTRPNIAEPYPKLAQKLALADGAGRNMKKLEITQAECEFLEMALASLVQSYENAPARHRAQPMFETVFECARRDLAVMSETGRALACESMAASARQASAPNPAADDSTVNRTPLGKRGWLSRLRH